MIGIYKITSPSNCINIGQSWDIDFRKGCYRRLECKGQVKIYASLKKYGWENHNFEIQEELPADSTQELLDEREIYWIKYYKDLGYEMLNLKEGGSHGKHSEETKRKMSKSSKRISHSKEIITKFITTRRKHYEENKEKGIFHKMPNRKFTEGEVIEIFRLFTEEYKSRSKIAKMYNCVSGTIANVLYSEVAYLDFKVKNKLSPVRKMKVKEYNKLSKIAYQKQFENRK